MRESCRHHAHCPPARPFGKQLLLRNQDGRTARDIALRCGEKEIAQFLKEKSSRWLSWLYRS